jgi:hypothetical protein
VWLSYADGASPFKIARQHPPTNGALTPKSQSAQLTRITPVNRQTEDPLHRERSPYPEHRLPSAVPEPSGHALQLRRQRPGAAVRREPVRVG